MQTVPHADGFWYSDSRSYPSRGTFIPLSVNIESIHPDAHDAEERKLTSSVDRIEKALNLLDPQMEISVPLRRFKAQTSIFGPHHLKLDIYHIHISMVT